MMNQPANMRHIAVLVSVGQHPTSGAPRHCHNDSLALAIGLDLAKKNAAQLQVLHAGDAQNPALQDYLAFGAHEINVVSATANVDNIVENLAAHLTTVHIILTGTRAENTEGSGLLPYLLAAKLNIPIVANALEIKPIGEHLEILQFLPQGKRRRVVLSLPAVIAVHPLASPQLRYVFASQQQGRITALSRSNNNNNMPNKVNQNTQWQIEPKFRQPNQLKAAENLTGHARLLVAISSESKNGLVVNEGNSVDKAQVILNYLREHQLINY